MYNFVLKLLIHFIKKIYKLNVNSKGKLKKLMIQCKCKGF